MRRKSNILLIIVLAVLFVLIVNAEEVINESYNQSNKNSSYNTTLELKEASVNETLNLNNTKQDSIIINSSNNKNSSNVTNGNNIIKNNDSQILNNTSTINKEIIEEGIQNNIDQSANDNDLTTNNEISSNIVEPKENNEVKSITRSFGVSLTIVE